MHKLGKCTVLVGAALTLGFETGAISPKSVEAATIVLNQTGFTGEALDALNFGVDVWSRYLNSPVPIRITATFNPSDPNNLGSASATSYQTGFTGGMSGLNYAVALANAISGTDLDPTQDDITMNFNSARSDWYFGTDPNAKQPEQSDFISTVVHEIAHGLGFSGTAEYDTETGIGTLGANANLGSDPNGLPDIYDRFVVNGSGENITQFPNNSVELGNQLISNNLFFNGPNAIAANGGTLPRLHAPTTWEPGSSYAHLDQDTYDVAGSLNADMIPRDATEAQPIRIPGPITLGVFRDQGWSVNVNGVPPTQVPFNFSPTLGLLLVGVGGAASKLKKHWKQKKSIKSIEPLQKSA